ncbi:hypothetical protein ACFQJC_00820 [Haloferax namakaokahaiae]|uniref:Uncharacterized protein n=1 Tax=Haloferax namakaokahaiae TaxID=1748331 RepID=A0ABD5Z9X4_9EURY
MVGPSLSDDETRNANNQIRVGFVLLNGLTGALIAFAGDATPLQTGLAFLGGIILGTALIIYLDRWSKEFVSSNRR